jgi:hypothetical protein
MDYNNQSTESTKEGIYRPNRYKINTRGPHRAYDSSYYKKGNNQVIKTIVRTLNIDVVKPQRSGIIIYTVVNGSIYFGLGLDTKTHDLTDFGGTVVYKKDFTAVRGAIREFEEETLGIFETFGPDDIKDCPVIYDEYNMIIFVHMDIDPDETSDIFNQKYKEHLENRKNKLPEVCGITWLNWEDFQSIIKQQGVLFSRVRRFLIKAGDFSYLL